MSIHGYEKAIAQEFCNAVLLAGLRPFLAEKGTYGFYTDAEGTRVVSFQVDLGTLKLSGNYKSQECGTGWVMGPWNEGDDLAEILKAGAPRWATNGEAVRLTTLEQHLKTYQQSSRYQEQLSLVWPGEG